MFVGCSTCPAAVPFPVKPDWEILRTLTSVGANYLLGWAWEFFWWQTAHSRMWWHLVTTSEKSCSGHRTGTDWVVDS